MDAGNEGHKPGEAPIDEECLVTAAQGGDEDAYRALFAVAAVRLELRIARTIPRALRRKVSVADILQEAYVAGWLGIESFRWRGPGAFNAWTQQIVLNKVTDVVRRFSTARRSLDREKEVSVWRGEDAATSREPSPLDGAIADELEVRMREALRQLPPTHQLVLRLVQTERLNMNEVGERMGRSPNAAQKLYERAKAALWQGCHGSDSQ